MKLATICINKEDIPILVDANKIYDLTTLYKSTKEIIETSDSSLNKIKSALKENKLKQILISDDQISWQPPVKYPNKLFCVAGNYKEHIKEGGNDADKQPEFTQAPWLFIVPPTTTMVGHNESVILPEKFNDIDYEGELAFIISKKAKNIKAENALDYVFGYTIFNDVSERKPFMIQGIENPRQLSFWYKKSFDTFGPTGPVMITKDEIPDPQTLEIRVSVNNEIKQKCNTSQMIFGVTKLIEFLSSFLTLEPGDVISTGTPAGVGMGSGVFLKPGDEMKIEIDKIGTLINKLVLSNA